MTAKTEIGGHLVSGHIHGTGEVLKVINERDKRFTYKNSIGLERIFFLQGLCGFKWMQSDYRKSTQIVILYSSHS